MQPYITDIAVSLIFFNRPHYLKQTFDAISYLRPSRLYLIQDGPRNEKDMANINKCREIVQEIDWNCIVTKIYSDTNLGCGERVYSGLNKVFEKEEFTVIIEDDIVISKDFLPFCKELSERYKNDERIGIICGMNHLGIYQSVPYSYFYSRNGGAIWGWGTWRRVWKNIDWKLECQTNTYIGETFAHSIVPYRFGKKLLALLNEKHESIKKNEKQTSWSFQFGFSTCYLQYRLNIVPKVNLIQNIGLIGEHSENWSNKIPKNLRLIYNAPVYDIGFPLNHPGFVIDDTVYAKRQEAVMKTCIFKRIFYKFNRVLYKYIKKF